MLDGIGARLDRSLYGGLIDGVHGDLQMVAVRFFDRRRQFRDGKVLLSRDLDDIHIVEDILPDRLPRLVGTVKYCASAARALAKSWPSPR